MAKNSGTVRSNAPSTSRAALENRRRTVDRIENIYESFLNSIENEDAINLTIARLNEIEKDAKRTIDRISVLPGVKNEEIPETGATIRRIQTIIDMVKVEKSRRKGLPEGWTRDYSGTLVSPISSTELPFMSPSRQLQEAAGVADNRLSIGTYAGRISIAGAKDANEANRAIRGYLEAAASQQRINNAVNNGASQTELENLLSKEIERLRRSR